MQDLGNFGCATRYVFKLLKGMKGERLMGSEPALWKLHKRREMYFLSHRYINKLLKVLSPYSTGKWVCIGHLTQMKLTQTI